MKWKNVTWGNIYGEEMTTESEQNRNQRGYKKINQNQICWSSPGSKRNKEKDWLQITQYMYCMLWIKLTTCTCSSISVQTGPTHFKFILTVVLLLENIWYFLLHYDFKMSMFTCTSKTHIPIMVFTFHIGSSIYIPVNILESLITDSWPFYSLLCHRSVCAQILH